MFPLAFVAGWLQGHWWGFISRNYVVWPTFLLVNVFIALKGSHFWFLSIVHRTSSVCQHFQTSSPQKALGQFKPNLMRRLCGRRNESSFEWSCHMTKMAAMPIYGENLKKSSSLEPNRWWSWNLVCSIGCSSTTKLLQMMTLSWLWPILRQGQVWSLMLLYGKDVKQWIFKTLL